MILRTITRPIKHQDNTENLGIHELRESLSMSTTPWLEAFFSSSALLYGGAIGG